MMFFVLFLFFCCPILVLIHFIYGLFTNKEPLNTAVLRSAEIFTVIVFPWLFLATSDDGYKNDCCNDNVFFSPSHRLTIYVLIILSVAAYFYSVFRKKLAPPLLEVIANCFLIVGILLNIAVGMQENDLSSFALFNLPIVLLFLLRLVKNQRLAVEHLKNPERICTNRFEEIAWKFLGLKVFIQIPLLALVCVPLLFIIVSILLLVGQKPDALVRAFTDTYRHGLSQLHPNVTM
jgi:hypothetical protein